MKKFIVLCLFFQMMCISAFAQQYRYHVVGEGETVFSIAQKYNTSKENIYKLNPDARNGITPNSKLVVPIHHVVQEENVEFKSHKVKRKETLFSLSQEYGVSIDDIKRYNKHLYAEELQRGERIRIPVNLPSQPEEEKTYVTDEPKENPLRLSRREHVVLPKEGKFRIAQKYNMTIEELDQLNPGIDTLHPGMVLKIAPKEEPAESSAEREVFQYYLVKPKETLFSLTQRLGISKDSLIVLNPALAEGLKAGMVLKIPNLEAAEISPYDEDAIVKLEDRITNYETKKLAVMLPFNLDRIQVTDTASNMQDRILRDGVLRLSLDFYSGVLMAIDSAETLGISSEVQVFDTRGNANQVNMLVNSNSFDGVDAVVGPLLQSTSEAVASKLERMDIPVISPLTKKENQGLENFIQTRPSDEMLEEAMLSYISENAAGKNLVTIVDSTWTDKQGRLKAAFPTARLITPREGSYIDPGELEEVLVEDQENWVILESDQVGILSNATSYLNSLRDKYDITLLTTNRNNRFESDDISNYHLRNLNFHFPSVDREYTYMDDNPFVQNYKEKYGMVPNTYAVRGFDITYDLLLRLASAEDLEKSLEEEITTQYVENKFNYEKKPSGGYRNRAIYIMAYDDSLKLKVVR